jgi:membrane-associated protein
MSTWIGDVPTAVVPALVAVLLFAESGLLIGVVMPAASLVLGLGVLAGAGSIPVPVAALVAATSTVAGAAVGHLTATRYGARSLVPESGVLRRLLPARAASVADRLSAPWVESVGRRPVRAAATAQFVAGGRTLAPRIAAGAGVPLTTMLRGTLPAALVWSSSLVTAGALASAALPFLRTALALAGVPLVVAATLVLVRRRAARPSGQPSVVAPAGIEPVSATSPRRARSRRDTTHFPHPRGVTVRRRPDLEHARRRHDLPVGGRPLHALGVSVGSADRVCAGASRPAQIDRICGSGHRPARSQDGGLQGTYGGQVREPAFDARRATATFSVPSRHMDPSHRFNGEHRRAHVTRS